MKKLLLISLLLTSCQFAPSSLDFSTNLGVKAVSDVKITTPPTLTFIPGEMVQISNYGAFTIFYDDMSQEEASIQAEQVNKIDYLSFTYEITFNDEIITLNLDYPHLLVNDSASLTAALMGEETLIIIAPGHYQITAGYNTTDVRRNKFIIGVGNPEIAVTGVTASQAALIVREANLTLVGISLRAEAKASLKLIAVNNSYLYNVNLYDGTGLDVYGSNLTANQLNVQIDPLTASAALKISNSDVRLFNSHISYGTWGSIGIMYQDDDLGATSLSVTTTTIDYVVYIENYQAYRELVVVSGLNTWNFGIMPDGVGVYYRDEHL